MKLGGAWWEGESARRKWSQCRQWEPNGVGRECRMAYTYVMQSQAERVPNNKRMDRLRQTGGQQTASVSASASASSTLTSSRC